MAYQYNTSRIKSKPPIKHTFNLMLHTQCTRDYLIEEPLHQSPCKDIGVSPWEDSEQPLNRLFTIYTQQTPKSMRPKSVNNCKKVTVSERLYKPWKLVPSINKELEQKDQSFTHSTIDLMQKFKPSIISLMPEQIKYMRIGVKTPNKNVKTIKYIRYAKPILKSHASKLLSKTSIRFYPSPNQYSPIFIGNPNKFARIHPKFLDTNVSPISKIGIDDIIKGQEVYSRLIKEKIRIVQKRVNLLAADK